MPGKPIQAGRFRHQLLIQQATETKDALGEVLQTWTTIATVPGRVTPLSGREQWLAAQAQAERHPHDRDPLFPRPLRQAPRPVRHPDLPARGGHHARRDPQPDDPPRNRAGERVAPHRGGGGGRHRRRDFRLHGGGVRPVQQCRGRLRGHRQFQHLGHPCGLLSAVGADERRRHLRGGPAQRRHADPDRRRHQRDRPGRRRLDQRRRQRCLPLRRRRSRQRRHGRAVQLHRHCPGQRQQHRAGLHRDRGLLDQRRLRDRSGEPDLERRHRHLHGHAGHGRLADDHGDRHGARRRHRPLERDRRRQHGDPFRRQRRERPRPAPASLSR